MADYSLGLVEVSALGNAIIMLDDMLKAADVEFVATERRLGGRLVTIVVRGELTSVKAAVDAGAARARENNCLKAAEVIARPHNEILKFLHLEEKNEEPVSETVGSHVGSVKKPVRRRNTSAKAEVKEEAAEVKPKRRGRKPKTEA